MPVARVRAEQTGNYFAKAPKGVIFIPTGCVVLDMALGGGWAEGRIENIVGTHSAGKTLLVIEAAANFAIKYPNEGWICYREAEAAFQKEYAAALGMPIDRVDFGDGRLETVEDFHNDLVSIIAQAKGKPVLYILDSLDALSDEAEIARDINQGTYGAEKAKRMSRLFRVLASKLESSRVTLIIISQVRAKIGAVAFGPQKTRSGGQALDFYASHVVYVTTLGKNYRTVGKIKRATSVDIIAKVEKNKVSLPYRDARFEIIFGYGINDVGACLKWLKLGGFLRDLNLTDKTMGAYERNLRNNPDADEIERLHAVVRERWFQIEKTFLPLRGKYDYLKEKRK